MPATESRERWGVIADDVTGACDVAAELHALGLRVAVMLGVPEPADVPGDVDVAVAGLTTRTAPRERAVRDSLAAARALSAAGATRWYQKYCSTFDSTDEGMIGPVAEALADAGGYTGSAGTPATPHADRSVYRGHLFVGDRLVSESSLARHPLTPMTDPDLVRVLGRQTTRPVELVDLRTVSAGPAAVAGAISASAAGHLLLDALGDEHLDVIAEAISAGGRLPGGGAGLISALGRRIAHRRERDAPAPEPTGERLVIAGSASDRTREQLAAAGGVTVAVDVAAAAGDPAAAVTASLDAVGRDLAAGRLPVVGTAASAPEVAAAQEALGVERAARTAEEVLAGVALGAVRELGVRRLLIAGGETSGAVTAALGIRMLRLTRSIDPGIAWATGRATAVPGVPELAVLLKSGNFGGAELLTRAWSS